MSDNDNTARGRVLRYLRIHQPDEAEDVQNELAFHLEMRAVELERRGLAPTTAQAEALRRLGDLESVRTECEILERESRISRKPSATK